MNRDDELELIQARRFYQVPKEGDDARETQLHEENTIECERAERQPGSPFFNAREYYNETYGR